MSGTTKRVAIVTGGARGIGRGISQALGQKGNLLAIVYNKDKKAAEEAKQEFSKFTDVMLIQADVSIVKEAERVVSEVEAKWGRVDVLVNNAGIFDYRTLEDMDEAFFERINRVNLYSAVFMSKAVIPIMKRQKWGRILNASSFSGRLADIGLIAYGCSKAGVDIMTRVLSGELGPWGITVNAYAPGIIATDMTAGIIKTRAEEKLNFIPASYFGEALDVGHLIAFLASEEARYITGEIIGVDGGMFKVQSTIKVNK